MSSFFGSELPKRDPFFLLHIKQKLFLSSVEPKLGLIKALMGRFEGCLLDFSPEQSLFTGTFN